MWQKKGLLPFNTNCQHCNTNYCTCSLEGICSKAALSFWCISLLKKKIHILTHKAPFSVREITALLSGCSASLQKCHISSSNPLLHSSFFPLLLTLTFSCPLVLFCTGFLRWLPPSNTSPLFPLLLSPSFSTIHPDSQMQRGDAYFSWTGQEGSGNALAWWQLGRC